MFEDLEPLTILLYGGALIGILFGVLAQSSKFCFRQAVIEAFEKKAIGQLRAWLIATFVAILGTHFLMSTSEIDFGESTYLVDALSIPTLLLGGMMFGAGMVLARGCAGRQVVLAAGGNLRSLIVIMFIALSGYMTMRGLFAPVRQSLEEVGRLDLANPDVSSAIAAAGGLEASSVQTVLIGLFAIGALFLLGRSIVKKSHVYLSISAAVIGGLVVGGWYLTGILGYDEFEPQRLESLTFVAPGGNTMQFLMIYTGATANFGIMLIGGVIAGAFVSALVRRELKLQGFESGPQMLRYLGGAVLMGCGAVMAIGCSIGQGLSGMSTLAFSSIISLSAIILGAVITLMVLRRLERPTAQFAAAE